MAHNLFLLEQGNLTAAFARSRNGRRLLSKPELREDVEFCLRRDSVPLVAELNRQGMVVKRD
jgi:phosphosulfolactate phosphohydrolase-like enzyme